MNLNISVTSARTQKEASVKWIQPTGPELKQGSKQRHRATWSVTLDKLESEIIRIWGAPLFHGEIENPHAEEIGVEFNDVLCKSVCGIGMGAAYRVIMTQPDNPIHSDLFQFRLNANLMNGRRSIMVSIDKPHINEQNLEFFLRLLKICMKEFYRKGNKQHVGAYFNSRKGIGHAKRRYLLWLGAQGQLDAGTRALWGNYHALDIKYNLTAGTYKGANSAWQRLIAVEQALQKI